MRIRIGTDDTSFLGTLLLIAFLGAITWGAFSSVVHHGRNATFTGPQSTPATTLTQLR